MNNSMEGEHGKSNIHQQISGGEQSPNEKEVEEEVKTQMKVLATPTTRANLEPSATVKYLLEPSNQVITIACSLKTRVGELREQLAAQIKMQSNNIKLLIHDEGTINAILYI